MATRSAILAVRIVSDARDFRTGVNQAASGLDNFKSKMKSLTVPALAIGAGLIKVGSDFGKMASDFEQNSGAVDAVFKGMSGQVDKLASESAKKLGLSSNDYKQYAALIGSQLKNGGTSMDQLVGKTDQLLNTGADFAAQFGGTVPDAVSALSSALKGEMDPIEKYGISLSAAKIDAEAAALGFTKVNGALTDQQKQSAIMSLINKQGADAQGANAREATTAAGAQARLTAAYGDMGVKLGTVLLPIMSQAAAILGVVVDWVSQNTTTVQAFAIVLGVLAAAILVINVVLAVMNAIALVNPFVLIAVAVVALIAVIIYLATQTTVFQDVWAAVSKFCSDVWNNFVGFITDVWDGFIGFLRDAVGNIGKFFNSVFSSIGNFISGVTNRIASYFRVAFMVAQIVVSSAINGIVSYFNFLLSVAGSILNWIGSAFGTIFNGARNIVSNVINGIVGGFNSVVNAVANVINWVSRLFNGFSIPGWLSKVMSFMGVGATGFDMAIGYDLAGLPSNMGATGTLGMAGIFGASSGRTEVTNVNITVEGALDPTSVARQLKQIINSDALRNGSISAGGSIW